MTHDSEDPGGTDDAASEDEADESTTEFESERIATRAAAATVLRRLATGVNAGAVSFGEGDDEVTTTLPDEFTLGLEYERDDEEAEIEVELGWNPEDSPSEVATPEDSPSEVATPDDGPDEAATHESNEVDGHDVETEGVESTAAGESLTEAEPAASPDEGGVSTDDATDPLGDGVPADEPWSEETVEAASPVPSQARFELFEDSAEEWRWRLVHHNGNVIASSGEGYTRKHNAKKGLRSVMHNAPAADVVETE